MIEKIYYLNLDRRPDRKEWFLSSMAGAGVPMGIVERMPSKDWQDYHSVQDMLVRMEVEDGLPQKCLIPNADLDREKFDIDWRGKTAYIWTMSKILKRIIEANETTLIMHDDYSLISWEGLTSALEHLSFFQAVQLGYDLHEAIPRNTVVPYNHIWNYGIQAYREEGIAYTIRGASRMLALLQGCYEGIRMVEDVLLDNFNNRWTFHPVDREKFTKYRGVEVHETSDIYSYEKLE